MDIYSNNPWLKRCTLFLVIALLLLITGCASLPPNQALERARRAYDTARTTPGVELNAPVALYEARGALEKAEKVTDDVGELEHLAYLAEKKSQLAVVAAEGKASEKEISQLSLSKDKILIKAREYEVDAARILAEQKAREAEQRALEAELARQEAEKSRLRAEEALAQKRQIEKELAELQAKQTDRGSVVTLGNILFQVDKSALLPGGFMAVDKLARFLRKYPERHVLIEGHTDSSGSDSYNIALSQRRANSVWNALMERAIDGERIVTKGYGEMYPVAGNETNGGRQQNRRVEVIILDEGVRPEQKFR